MKYKTLSGEGRAEIIIEKSKFIGCARDVSSRAEADKFFAKLRAEHKSATHCVPAFALNDKQEIIWASDDKEPQGTAGAPIKALLVSLEITYACVMVVRYFGGVKLGTGGLARAYTEAAKLAIEAAGTSVVEEAIMTRYEIDYPFWDRLKNVLDAEGENVSDITYADKIMFTVTPTAENSVKIQDIIKSLTSGNAIIAETKILDIKHGII